MHVVASSTELRSVLAGFQGGVGLVPTMGALHAGHASLMRQARSENETLVVSVFVNPKQFGPHEDFGRYPRDLAHDAAVCREAGVDVLFAPSVEAMYPQGFATEVAVGPELTDRLCGASRPGHFAGVTTVVCKLLSLVRPDRAYFGQKDFQQWRVIQRMVTDLGLSTEIVRHPTVREPDGLAMSSRNRYLAPEEREVALRLSRALGLLVKRAGEARADLAEALAQARAYLAAEPRLSLEYLEVVDERDLRPLTAFASGAVALVAGRVGATRLIDNAILDPLGPDAGLVAHALEEIVK